MPWYFTWAFRPGCQLKLKDADWKAGCGCQESEIEVLFIYQYGKLRCYNIYQYGSEYAKTLGKVEVGFSGIGTGMT